MAQVPMRTLIAGNWKMHGLQAQLAEIAAMAQSIREQPDDVDVLVCVPAEGDLFAIGCEDCSAEEAGSFTGYIDAEMMRDAGATSLILGHSERRQRHNETEAQRRAGDALKVCGAQLAASLPDIPDGAGTAIAYEPLWAIGSGAMPKRSEIVEVLTHVRRVERALRQRRPIDPDSLWPFCQGRERARNPEYPRCQWRADQRCELIGGRLQRDR
jgi:triosephosphate isomerase